MRGQSCLEQAPNGDCYRTCLATITGIPAGTMPNFMHLPGVQNGDHGTAHARGWLRQHGLTLFDTWVTGAMSLEQVLADCSGYNSGVPVILTGRAEKVADYHSVVLLDGRIVHDPSGAGIAGPMPCQCGAEGCERADWSLQIVVPLKVKEPRQ